MSNPTHAEPLVADLKRIAEEIAHAVDDEVLHSLERMFEMAVFSRQVRAHNEVMDELCPAFQFIQRMRKLLRGGHRHDGEPTCPEV